MIFEPLFTVSTLVLAVPADVLPLAHRRALRPPQRPHMTRQAQQGTATAQSHESRRRSTRSPSVSSSVTFTPANRSVENGKGVQDITRKVIRQLEGLGHLEVQDMDTTPPTPYEESEDGESVASASGHSTRRSSVSGSNGHATNGHTNGHSKAMPVEKPVDFEIPRKLLHSSIGVLTRPLSHECH